MCELCEADEFGEGDFLGEIEDTPEMEAARERVAQGVSMLDVVKPNWRSYVTGIRIDMINGSTCIAGRVFAEEADLWGGFTNTVYNGYDYVCNVLGSDRTRQFGFTAGYTANGVYVDYYELQQAWEDVINAG